VKRRIPTPKNEASTKPRAASSLCLVVARRSCTVPAPSKPASVAPTKIASGSLDIFQRNPRATPGSTACERASPSRESLRTTRKVPIKPQQTPSSIEPASALRSEGSLKVKNRTVRSIRVESDNSLIRAASTAPGIINAKLTTATKHIRPESLTIGLRVFARRPKEW
jgi:hypothetical protein